MSRLLVPKWIELIITLYNTPEEYRYSQKLKYKVKTTSSHMRKLLRRLEASGLVFRRRTRKIQYLILTSKGRQIAQLLLKIKQEVRR